MVFFFSSRRRHTRCSRDWSSDVCSSDLAGKAIRGQGKARINRQRFLEFVAGLLELPQILKGPPKCVVRLERIRLRAEDDAQFVSSSLWRVILQERKRKLVADFVPIGAAGQCCLKGGDRTAKL